MLYLSVLCIFLYLSIGLPCAVRLEDNLWYRAKIVEVIENDNVEKKIKVYCVDLGCIISLDFPSKLNSIQEIPYAYTLLNAQVNFVQSQYSYLNFHSTFRFSNIDFSGIYVNYIDRLVNLSDLNFYSNKSQFLCLFLF